MLPASTHPGQVHLTVSDLDRSLGFYQKALGFTVHSKGESGATLGAGAEDLLVLYERPGAVKYANRTGLYHFAILVPSRVELARSLKNLIDSGARLSGGADHLVSEALYLDDPDGNGIEIYRDRPRPNWPRENGRLIMGTEPLDYQGILAELQEDQPAWTGLDKETALGHMHLHVSDIEEATAFYTEIFGFDLVFSLARSASFLSAGGYHHHLGINIWNGPGAPPPPADSIGLRYFTLQLPDREGMEELRGRLTSASWPCKEVESGLYVEDPSKNGILVVAEFPEHGSRKAEET